jgi:hypothetical protein
MILTPQDNLLLYGLTASGKTTQLAEVIKVMARESGKPALAYITDWGSCGPLHALAQAGLLKIEEFRYGTDPFVWIDSAVQGLRLVNGKWVKPDHQQFCLGAMESLTGQGDLVLNALGHQAAAGFGGDATKAPALSIKTDVGPIRVPSNSPTHYGMAQKHLLEKVWQSQLLPFPVIWTAHEDVAVPEKRDDMGNIRAEVAVAPGVRGMIGPLVAGHALTMHLGKYFVFTFRIKVEPGPTGPVHTLLTERHKDGLYEGLAANRAPFGTKIVVPGKVVPANVVQVLQKIQEARAAEVVSLGGKK